MGWDEDGERPLARSADVPLRCRRRVWEDFGESGPNLTLGAGEVVGDSGDGDRDEGSLRASSRAYYQARANDHRQHPAGEVQGVGAVCWYNLEGCRC